MPYAANGVISQDEIEGGVDISDAEYMELLDGMMTGQVVTIEGGEVVLVDPPPPQEPEAQPEPDPVDPQTAAEKLAAFLSANPDVMDLIKESQ